MTLFLCQFGIKLFLVDDEAFMPAFEDDIYTIVGLDLKHQPSAFHFDLFDARLYPHAGWGGRLVSHINRRANCLFLRPIKVRVDAFDAGPLQKAGGKDLRHREEFFSFRIQRRDGF